MHDTMWKPVLMLGLIAALTGCAADVSDTGESSDAITAGTPDDANEYPEVAIVAAVFPDDTWFPACSGVLVEDDIVLTVAHCELDLPHIFQDITGFPLPPTYRWGVVFTQSVEFANPSPAPSTPFSELEASYLGDIHSRPGYRLGFPGQRQADGADNNDFAAILLDERVRGIRPAILPPVGFLDRRNGRALERREFTMVGHGLDFVANPTGRYDGVRRIGRAGFDALDDRGTLHLNTNQADGYTSMCYADSGGPVFYGNKHILVALNDELHPSCFGPWNEAQRLDIQDAADFLRPLGVHYFGDRIRRWFRSRHDD